MTSVEILQIGSLIILSLREGELGRFLPCRASWMAFSGDKRTFFVNAEGPILSFKMQRALISTGTFRAPRPYWESGIRQFYRLSKWHAMQHFDAFELGRDGETHEADFINAAIVVPAPVLILWRVVRLSTTMKIFSSEILNA